MHNELGDIRIVSIHDMDPRGFLAFDLADVLKACTTAQEYDWVVVDIECTGSPIPSGVVMSSRTLLEHCRRAGQTITATVMAFPNAASAPVGAVPAMALTDFPRSQARVAILAIDSSHFEVLSKDPDVIDQVRHAFRDVRGADPSQYFASIG